MNPIMKLMLPIVLLLCTLSSVKAQQLKFNTSGKYKIVQFTDIHYKANVAASKKSIDMMNATLEAEKPDLVVFTGDIVVADPLAQGWDEVLATAISRKIPYMVTLGNHDDEAQWSRPEIAKYISQKPLLVNKQVEVEGVRGVLNAQVSIMGTNGKAGYSLYIMDSNAYSKVKSIPGYDWFSHDQVSWYVDASKKVRSENDSIVPALAFFHIPLPEYQTAFDNLKNKRLGVRYEGEASPIVNSGMFVAMATAGDVVGTFVGHDHVNDYLVDYLGVGLAYGCFSGSENTYVRGKNGARIIEIKEGVRAFHTYIRESDGAILYKTDFPFAKK
ncbi:metallophosphoesterase family protein [Sphingobacterium sp. SYP-B4668]|uniref:metallophosphoesterase family protein n=1 Tax=Sphingobacterium sp. SYP-B4668 TaxID=2996035 RepID=UPI0022DE0E9C|nr:metallophosphoesterase family protein [Sphingobacterium sp. SYP-B4668]